MRRLPLLLVLVLASGACAPEGSGSSSSSSSPTTRPAPSTTQPSSTTTTVPLAGTLPPGFEAEVVELFDLTGVETGSVSAYAGAGTITELHDRATVGVQTRSGFADSKSR